LQKVKVTVEEVDGVETKDLFKYDTSPINYDNILAKWKKFNKRITLHLHPPKGFSIPERINESFITHSWYAAIECFGICRYEVSILFAAIAVEAAINHDDRMQEYRGKSYKQWITLSPKSLAKVKEVGIDISDLIESDNGEIVSKFVELRNKIAHGDNLGAQYILRQFNHNTSIEYTDYRISEKDALEQIEKSYNFLVKWGKSEPIVVLSGIEEIRFE